VRKREQERESERERKKKKERKREEERDQEGWRKRLIIHINTVIRVSAFKSIKTGTGSVL